MNKFCSTLILVLATFFTSYSQIDFENISLEEALEKANKEGKKVFIDVYTSWCGPCKIMDAEVFSDALLGERMSKSYIALKIDKEKSPHRKDIAKYPVKGYPTMLILDPKGLEIGRIYGRKNLGAFNKELDAYKNVKNHPIVDAIEAMKKQPNSAIVWRTSLHLLGKDFSLLSQHKLMAVYRDACENYYEKFNIKTIEGEADLRIFGAVKLPLEYPVVQFYLKDSIGYGTYLHINYMALAFKDEIKKAKTAQQIEAIKVRAEVYYDYCFKARNGHMEDKSGFMAYIFESENEITSEIKNKEGIDADAPPKLEQENLK